MIRHGLRILPPILALVAVLAACSTPRAHANVHLTPDGVRVVPALTTSVGGIGVTVSK